MAYGKGQKSSMTNTTYGSGKSSGKGTGVKVTNSAGMSSGTRRSGDPKSSASGVGKR